MANRSVVVGHEDEIPRRIKWLAGQIKENGNLKSPDKATLKKCEKILSSKEYKDYGYSTLIQQYVRSMNCFSLEERAVINQWLEFSTIYIDRCNNKSDLKITLKKLNSYLSTRQFVSGVSLSLADLILYLSIHQSISQLSFQEKEEFQHVSRWFRNVQRIVTTPKWTTPVIFSRNILY